MADRLPLVEYLRTKSVRSNKTVAITDGQTVAKTNLEGTSEDTIDGIAALVAAQKRELIPFTTPRKAITAQVSAADKFRFTPQEAAAMIRLYADETPAEPAAKRGKHKERGGVDPALLPTTDNGTAGT